MLLRSYNFCLHTTVVYDSSPQCGYAPMLRRLECYLLAVLGAYLPICVIALGEDQRQRTAVVLAAAAMTIAAAGAAACANAARKTAATFVAAIIWIF